MTGYDMGLDVVDVVDEEEPGISETEEQKEVVRHQS